VRKLVAYGLCTLVIGALDVWVHAGISLWVLYLFPLGLATWNLGLRWGLCIAGLSSLLLAGTWLHGVQASQGLGSGIALASRLLVFGLVVWLVSALRAKEVSRVVSPNLDRGD
jgi:hypothetical protein